MRVCNGMELEKEKKKLDCSTCMYMALGSCITMREENIANGFAIYDI